MAEHVVSIYIQAGTFHVTYKPDQLTPARRPAGDKGNGVDKDAAFEFLSGELNPNFKDQDTVSVQGPKMGATHVVLTSLQNALKHLRAVLVLPRFASAPIGSSRQLKLRKP